MGKKRKSRLDAAYYNMHSRCDNPNTPKYENHGGRGICVCDEWSGKNGKVNFIQWAKDNGYAEGLTLDRIDNNGNYEPDNCRWVDYATQNRNLRTNRYFTINGESKIAPDWCKEYGLNLNTFWQRVIKGMDGEDLIAPPARMSGKNKSGFVGVRQRKDTGKWIAILEKDYMLYRGGNFDNMDDAIIARLKLEKEHYGMYLQEVPENIKLKLEEEN